MHFWFCIQTQKSDPWSYKCKESACNVLKKHLWKGKLKILNIITVMPLVNLFSFYYSSKHKLQYIKYNDNNVNGNTRIICNSDIEQYALFYSWPVWIFLVIISHWFLLWTEKSLPEANEDKLQQHIYLNAKAYYKVIFPKWKSVTPSQCTQFLIVFVLIWNHGLFWPICFTKSNCLWYFRFAGFHLGLFDLILFYIPKSI